MVLLDSNDSKERRGAIKKKKVFGQRKALLLLTLFRHVLFFFNLFALCTPLQAVYICVLDATRHVPHNGRACGRWRRKDKIKG